VGRVRRIFAAMLVGLGVLCAGASPASGAQLETWLTQSRFVDPLHVKLNGPSPGQPELAPGLRVDVLLPDGFDPSRRYPVLYLLHGHGGRFDAWVAPTQGDLLTVASGFGGIIVMPEAANGWYANWWNGGARGGPAWERYHLDELVPLVKRRLPIRSGRRWHAIAGLSMGGEGAMYYASQRPGYFGTAASFSGPLSIQRPEWPSAFDTQGESHLDVFGDPQAQDFYWAGHNAAALAANLTHSRLYVAAGDGTPDPTRPGEVTNIAGQVAEILLRRQAADFVTAAEAAGDAVTYRPHAGIHSWRYWQADLADAIRWGLFEPVAEHPGRWTFSTVAQRGDAWGLRFSFDSAPSSVERLVLRNGRRLAGAGDTLATLRTPSGCRLRLDLAGAQSVRLPRGWRSVPRSKARRRHARQSCARVAGHG